MEMYRKVCKIVQGTNFAVWCPSVQRRTLIISELETRGALETPLTKQVENLETEMGLR